MPFHLRSVPVLQLDGCSFRGKCLGIPRDRQHHHDLSVQRIVINHWFLLALGLLGYPR